ncbi:MAG: O-antigen ligase family protein [Bacteroidia bacterium]|nr:O-antigen ligase family protein [Bacteroidia bacterium]
MDSRKINLIKIASFCLPVFLGFLTLILSAWALSTISGQDIITMTELTPLSYISMALFLIVCFLGMYSSKLYFAFLVFILLAFPAPVNDFFPGTFLGSRFEFGASIFPFITHIDIYLLLGIFKGMMLRNRISVIASVLFLCVIVAMFISIAINFFDYSSPQELALLVQGLFQFRYLVLLFVMISFYDVNKYKNYILVGIIASVLFLFTESVAFTIKSKADALMSGSLANNTYASIIASVLLFFYLIKRKYKHSKLYNTLLKIGITFCVIIVIATKARMAILALVVSYFIISFIENRQKQTLKSKLYWIGTIILFVISVKLIADRLPKRYNPHTITDKISIGEPDWDLTRFIRIERSWETNSLITRLELYSTSIKMIRENPVAGVGVGRWNYLKQKYGFREFLLIDSHNGYFSVLSQYGFLGIPLIIFIYFFPIYMIFRNSGSEKADYSYLVYFSVVNLYISFADLSNSGIFKHQIFSFLAFNAICLMKLNAPSGSDATTREENLISKA